MREKPLYANSFCKVKVTCIHFNQSYVFHSFDFNSYLYTIKMRRIFSTLLSMSHNLQQFFESNILKILSNHRVMMLKNSFYDHSFDKIFKRRTRVCALQGKLKWKPPILHLMAARGSQKIQNFMANPKKKPKTSQGIPHTL